jgi:hypothetical protein
MTNAAPATHLNVDHIIAPEQDAPTGSNSDMPTTTTAPIQGNQRYETGFNEVPAAYVKQIQTGEFFDLSKLLPSNSYNASEDEPVTLTLENSVLKVKKSSQSVAKITEIEPWTTAFSTYMGVLTDKFPNRAQEFLKYMSLIRHAARTHRGLGWCIYDHKFRQKASLNPALDWSIIDQQLWLLIFTVSPEILRRENPLFNNGPQKPNSSGGERGICIEYNRRGECSHQNCRYRHICNQCYGTHARRSCPQPPPKPNEYSDNLGSTKRNRRSAKS